MLENYIRRSCSRIFTGEQEIALKNEVPSLAELHEKFQDIEETGIYLHIPFCEQICPYCPYNKEIYDPAAAQEYVSAVKKEIELYAEILNRKPVTSFYIGGGTPTTMLHSGLEEMIGYIYEKFNMQCDIHLESHPNHLNQENLEKIKALGVQNLSIGMEALQDRHLKTLHRPYDAAAAQEAVNRAVSMNFKCVNADFIFALPDQTEEEVKKAGEMLVNIGVDQVAAYPLFRFPYTKMGSMGKVDNFHLSTIFKRRKMLRILEKIFYGSGYERSSVWAFTRKGQEKYCSVTVPLYIGLGASGGTYLKDIFYLNTFNVSEYISSMEKRGNAFALSIDLSAKLQMAGWLYWRIYETKFRKADFKKRFGRDFDTLFGRYTKFLALLGFLKDDSEQVILTNRGTFWLHAFEDIFSIDYISTLWGTSKQNPWPEKVVL
ncbi:MAG: radical SAM protein [Candidatus Cloacimonetes bacterium]|nr:radical SAM protein [Candidatus Cloacimonadota bacterium]